MSTPETAPWNSEQEELIAGIGEGLRSPAITAIEAESEVRTNRAFVMHGCSNFVLRIYRQLASLGDDQGPEGVEHIAIY